MALGTYCLVQSTRQGGSEFNGLRVHGRSEAVCAQQARPPCSQTFGGLQAPRPWAGTGHVLRVRVRGEEVDKVGEAFKSVGLNKVSAVGDTLYSVLDVPLVPLVHKVYTISSSDPKRGPVERGTVCLQSK